MSRKLERKWKKKWKAKNKRYSSEKEIKKMKRMWKAKETRGNQREIKESKWNKNNVENVVIKRNEAQ